MPPSTRDAVWQSATTPHTPPTPPAVILNTPPSASYMQAHPPPDLKIPMGEWHAMTPEERTALWTPPKNPELPALPPASTQQAHPPPGVNIPMGEWHAMDPEERSALWKSTVPHVETPELPPASTQQAHQPPGANIPMGEWRAMAPEERSQAWSDYAANNTKFVANPTLRDSLQANKDLKLNTVQDLINYAVHTPNYNETIKSFGLDPRKIEQYRSANLMDLAVVRTPPAGTLPADIAQANVYHLVEFNTRPYGTPYNTSFPGKDPFSDNCGPASLAMALRISGQMPGGLNAEQQIDYARYLITGSSNGSVTTAPGTEIKLDDHDLQTLGFGEIANAEVRNNVPMTSTNGWAALDDALANGHPVVAAGYITKSWTAEFPDRGTYGSLGSDRVGHFVAVVGKTPDGKYLVSDPMWTGGAVTMTLDQLKVFTGSNPLVTTVGQ